ncbi:MULTISPECIES: FimV/HubP family polar landmark protein [unclassified Caballeronia]|uniref:FimV/HubP family polar landmark protein n=1 Tax=unclassified Caballeronia TaxID=2646786 RepID=UPI0028666D2C|nr:MULTISPECIES: FimV/HubP family polar landmark protein [unclassified Caballeronia]MDR5818493.1 FimV/HubP family polar landmark protein [Caballeronia sp. LZ033]MDR5883338.1 FimV/HubP family polar landmark protein [Caballeronia sp. LZ032]
MIQRPRRSLVSTSRAALAAVSLTVCAMFWAHPGDAFAQASDAASAAAPGQTYAVKPGQSLNDIAGELTGSKDRDVKARAARALFDANPTSFGNHDINKLKLGAVLNVPADLSGASAPAAASASASASAPVEAATAASAPVAPASESAPAMAASAAPASSVAPAASAPADTASTPTQTTEPAPAPAVTASASASTAPAKSGGMSPMLIGLVIAVIVVLMVVMRMRRGKQRPTEAADDARSERGPEAGAAAAALARADEPVEESQPEIDAAAANLERAEAPQIPAARSESDLPPTTEAHPSTSARATPEAPREVPVTEAFTPVAPAAHHPDFVPPMPGTLAGGDATEQQAQEALEHERSVREAVAREAESREAELRKMTEREEQAREAAEKEIVGREAELRDLQARTADEPAHSPDLAPDEEPVLRHSFPMPKFPQEAIQALDSLDMALPPRMELKAEPSPAAPVEPAPTAALEPPPREALPDTPPVSARSAGEHEIDQTPIEQAPFVPQPVANPPAQASEQPSVASQIEAGTAGAASVAGLGATRFGPLSLDFDLGPSSSATEPLPALTPAQLATIARNKLELAAEYIELGDLQGARTLLQEVIESNDSATRQQAATLLSTLAPHS